MAIQGEEGCVMADTTQQSLTEENETTMDAMSETKLAMADPIASGTTPEIPQSSGIMEAQEQEGSKLVPTALGEQFVRTGSLTVPSKQSQTVQKNKKHGTVSTSLSQLDTENRSVMTPMDDLPDPCQSIVFPSTMPHDIQLDMTMDLRQEYVQDSKAKTQGHPAVPISKVISPIPARPESSKQDWKNEEPGSFSWAHDDSQLPGGDLPQIAGSGNRKRQHPPRLGSGNEKMLCLEQKQTLKIEMGHSRPTGSADLNQHTIFCEHKTNDMFQDQEMSNYQIQNTPQMGDKPKHMLLKSFAQNLHLASQTHKTGREQASVTCRNTGSVKYEAPNRSKCTVSKRKKQPDCAQKQIRFPRSHEKQRSNELLPMTNLRTSNTFMTVAGLNTIYETMPQESPSCTPKPESYCCIPTVVQDLLDPGTSAESSANTTAAVAHATDEAGLSGLSSSGEGTSGSFSESTAASGIPTTLQAMNVTDDEGRLVPVPRQASHSVMANLHNKIGKHKLSKRKK